jgi:alpha-tubulin suppressor-like RCC1 family protein
MLFKSTPLWGGLCLLFSAGAAMAQAPVNTFAASTNHSATIRPDGSLWTWGINYEGQLGNGTTTQSAAPVQVLAQNPNMGWTQVATGTSHTLAVGADGRLYAWGSNAVGQLGDGTNTAHSKPVAVDMPPTAGRTTWKQIAAGTSHSLALTDDGRLYAWGQNAKGQLGNDYRRDRNTPVEVPLPLSAVNTTWAQVAAGSGHTLALTADGRLYAWGSNEFGQLGDGTEVSTLLPVAVGLTRELAGLRWSHVAAGRYHTVAVTTDGRLYGWGSNRFGQLASTSAIQHNLPTRVELPFRLKRTVWKQVAAGDVHTLALSTDGRLAAWGNNCAGQLGDGSTAFKISPVMVTMPQSAASAKWAGIASGGFHTLAFTTDGQLCAWGANNFGQLGDGTTTEQHLPMRQDPMLTSRPNASSASLIGSRSTAPSGAGELNDEEIQKWAPVAPSFMMLPKPKDQQRP